MIDTNTTITTASLAPQSLPFLQHWLLTFHHSVNGNSTLLTSGFVPSPRSRGTIDILFTSLATLSICIWTAIHPDILPPLSTPLQRLFSKCTLAFLAVLAPERVLANAVQDYLSALHFLKSWHGGSWAAYRAHASSSGDLPFAFFAVMGGFHSPSRTRLTPTDLLSPHYKAHLQQHYAVHRRLIADKSSRSPIATAVAVNQAAYLIISLLSRRAQHLPWTPIEAYTLMNVFFSLVEFVLWAHKPQDVNDPIILPSPPTTTSPSAAAAATGALEKPTGTPEPPDASPDRHLGGVRTLYLALDLIAHRPLTPGARAMTMATSLPLTLGSLLNAWYQFFPTRVERQLWIAAYVGIGVLPMVALAVDPGGKVVGGVRVWVRGDMGWGAAMGGRQMRGLGAAEKESGVQVEVQRAWTVRVMWRMGRAAVVAVLYAMYVVARVYLLVEGVYALRVVREQAYVVGGWSHFLPHW